MQAVLTQTFPQVKVVLDAPVQMGRELTLLRQATGAATRQDLENLLTALGQAQPPLSLALSKLDYSDGELRLQGAGLKDDTVQTLRNTLEAQGYVLRLEGGTLSLTYPNRSKATP